MEKGTRSEMNLRETKSVEKLMPEMMAKVVVPLHIMDMWLGGGGREIWCGLTEKKMNGCGKGTGRFGSLGMRETTEVLERGAGGTEVHAKVSPEEVVALRGERRFR